MSTFNGLVREFPRIRIDYFRHHRDQPAPAALFLSHVHSDHLLGLESVKMPFVYCSSTTRRILLKMEKYPHRINFAKGILEARKQHYKHLKTVLRAVPMNTSTELELGPKSVIRVTLLDANHCPGSVMFLIEGDGKAILYIGDVRAEPWWVNSIVQNPIILPYTCGLKRLDCLYLDTTFATHDEPYQDFPTKAEGLRELLSKVSLLPPDTIFYFRAWTLGYENVWITLSNFLQSKVHVNQYQLGIFHDGTNHESAALTEFTLGNDQLRGCLTDEESAKIHSCEPGLSCHTKIKGLKNVVWISPIISRLRDGTEIRELGAGGGWKDLYPTAQFKLEDSVTMLELLDLCAFLPGNDEMREKVTEVLAQSSSMQDVYVALDKAGEVQVKDESSVNLEEFFALLSRGQGQEDRSVRKDATIDGQSRFERARNDTIFFPYSRHSSYNELRHLVSVFRPGDICPCTVCLETWSEELSMKSLFGDLCCEQTFSHDQETREQAAEEKQRRALETVTRTKRKHHEDDDDSQRTQSQSARYYDPSSPVVFTSPVKAPVGPPEPMAERVPNGLVDAGEISTSEARPHGQQGEPKGQRVNSLESQPLSLSAFDSSSGEDLEMDDKASQGNKRSRKQARISAYQAARLAIFGRGTDDWEAVPLKSVGHGDHTGTEHEL